MSSDDDVPMVHRNAVFLSNKTKQVLIDSDDEQSDLPSWLVNHKSPEKKQVVIPISSDSDSDLKEILSPVKLLSSQKSQQPASGGSQQPIPAAATNKDEAGPSKKPASTKKPSPPKKTSTKKLDASQQLTTKSGSQPTTTTTATAATAKPTVSRLLPVATNELPIVLPDKISQLKVLVELESTGEVHGATDLSGDSGAIGRFIVNKDSTTGQQTMQLDLKGILYNATIVPTPVTMAVVNFGPTEGKVECFIDEFVQLREDPQFAEDRAALLDDLYGEDQDETYADGAGGDGEKAAGGKRGKKGDAKAAKPKAAGRKTAAGKGSRGGGVKKTTKPRAKPKAKPKGKK